jgi:hypothetical protein
MSRLDSHSQLQLWPITKNVPGFPGRHLYEDVALAHISPRSLAAIIDEHAVELALRRRRLFADDSPDKSAWAREIEFFTREIIEPQLGSSAVRLFGAEAIKHAVDSAARRPMGARILFDLDSSSSPFEHRVADALEDLGWKTELTNGTGCRQLDVISYMRRKSVLIHCIYSSTTVPYTSVLDIYTEVVAAGFDCGAIVSNASFQSRARHHSACTRTVLLHHGDLHRLEEQIFGTDTWRTLVAKMPHGIRKPSGGDVFT